MNAVSGLVSTITEVRNMYAGKMLCAGPIKTIEVYEAAFVPPFVVPIKGCLCFRFS